MKLSHLITVAWLCLVLSVISCTTTPKYKNSSLPVDKRVEDLLGRMTLEEKAAQLDMLSAKDLLVDGKSLCEDSLDHFIDSMCIGSIHDFYPETAEMVNTIQKRALEHSRLGIPLLFIEEGLHGYQGCGATAFPAPIANSCTWDTTLVHNIGHVIATEARIHGVHFILGPNLDVAHEIRWGRVEETYGEDPYLSARLAVNQIKGMQGGKLSDPYTVVAEPKHFAAYGIPQNGTNTSPAYVGEREARSTYMYTFEKAVTEAGAKGIMAAYHDIDGVPCASNKWLLTDVLRNEWGFDGVVVSDLGAIRRLVKPHRTAENPEQAVCQSINAGMNVQFYDFPYDVFQRAIVDAVREGKLDEKVVNARVADMLRLKFELGLFEHPYVSEEEISRFHHCEEHRQLAAQAADEAVVMLKNDGLLPLDPDVKRITVIGENANRSLLGGYSPAMAKGVTVFEGLRKRFGDQVEIDFLEREIENDFKSIPYSALYLEKEGQHGIHQNFYNNTELSGTPAFVADVPEVTAYWHNLSPAPGVNRDGFSIRYDGWVKIPVSGQYEIRLKGRDDDQVRLFLDDVKVIDNWYTGKKNPDNCTKYFKAGEYVRIHADYAELQRNAGIDLEWRLTGSYDENSFYHQVSRAVSASDVTVLVLGEGASIVGEGKDRQNLNMSEGDVRLLQTVAATGKPFTTIMIHGRPFVMTPVDIYSNAILDAWFLGEAGGDTISDILFGEVNPSGKLTMSVPKCQGQLPVFYLKKNSTRKKYVDGDTEPLYPFGHGLSYTSFKYEDLQITPENPAVTDQVIVSFRLSNTGKVAGTEVCQLYLEDVVSSVSVPEKALKGFARVNLAPGETKTVTIRLKPEHFSLLDLDMKRVVEPGQFVVMVGSSSKDIRLKGRLCLK